MPVVSFLTNTASIAAVRQLDRATEGLGRSFERLSSGMRINRPSDDAAGQAIATGLHVRARVYTQGFRNANDAISALNIAEGSTGELSGILTRLKELSSSAANGTYSLDQRLSLDKEADQLVKEFNRLVSTTEFNGLRLIDGKLGEISAQLGYGSAERIGFSPGAGLATGVGTGSYTGATAINIGTSNATTGVTADFNGDGILDIAHNNNALGSIDVNYGNGSGGFKSTKSLSTAGGLMQVVGIQSADVNNDGRPDIIANTVGGLQVFLNQGGTTIAAATRYGTSSTGLGIADFNGDGRLDLATGSGTDVLIRSGNGDGTFGASTKYVGKAAITSLTVGDFDGDGRMDVLTKATIGTTNLFHTNSDGTLAMTTTSSITGGNSNFMLSNDFNQDGKLDIATLAAGAVRVAFGNGDGSFAAATSYTIAGVNSTNTFYSADFNSDGMEDLVVTTAGRFAPLINNGDGTFNTSARVIDGISTSAGFAIPGDFDGDGVQDILAIDNDDNSTARFLMQNASNSSTIGRLNLTTRADALSALTSIDTIMQRLTTEIGNIGASQSRLLSALNTLGAQSDNYRAAAGRIQDADIAAETSQMIRYQILRQASAAVLAQANQMPEIGLTLLRG